MALQHLSQSSKRPSALHIQLRHAGVVIVKRGSASPPFHFRLFSLQKARFGFPLLLLLVSHRSSTRYHVTKLRHSPAEGFISITMKENQGQFGEIRRKTTTAAMALWVADSGLLSCYNEAGDQKLVPVQFKLVVLNFHKRTVEKEKVCSDLNRSSSS